MEVNRGGRVYVVLYKFGNFFEVVKEVFSVKGFRSWSGGVIGVRSRLGCGIGVGWGDGVVVFDKFDVLVFILGWEVVVEDFEYVFVVIVEWVYDIGWVFVVVIVDVSIDDSLFGIFVDNRSIRLIYLLLVKYYYGEKKNLKFIIKGWNLVFEYVFFFVFGWVKDVSDVGELFLYKGIFFFVVIGIFESFVGRIVNNINYVIVIFRSVFVCEEVEVVSEGFVEFDEGDVGMVVVVVDNLLGVGDDDFVWVKLYDRRVDVGMFVVVDVSFDVDGFVEVFVIIRLVEDIVVGSY